MDVVAKTALSALISISVMFVLARIIGKRQVSQMSLFDYINGITLGSIAAELAISSGRERLVPLTAMVVYAAVSVIIALSTCKSIKLRRFFVGKPVILFENDTIYEKNLLRARLDVNEFLTGLRTLGYFDLSQVEFAVLEINGSISVMPKSHARPATPDDHELDVDEERPTVNVIIDGCVMQKNLNWTGNNEVWLANELKKQNVRLVDVVLACVDAENRLSIFEKTGRYNKKDIYI